MTMYLLTFRKQTTKALQKMPGEQNRRVRDVLDNLAANPDRRDLDIDTLKGRPGYRLRIGGFRVIFMRDDAARIINVVPIAARGDVYKR